MIDDNLAFVRKMILKKTIIGHTRATYVAGRSAIRAERLAQKAQELLLLSRR
jgi:chorismate-pyruvate lyase